MKQFNPTKYQLQSLCCGTCFPDKYWELQCPQPHPQSLIRTIYENRQIHLHPEYGGIYTFSDWLPVERMLEGSGAPVTYQSQGLAGHLGLNQLFITFNGYWPERGAWMKSGSFKECEAFSVCARTNSSKGIMVVASAGNTARAFARVCSQNRIPLLLTVPLDNIQALWFDSQLDPCVKVIACEKGGDYFDAIHLSNIKDAWDQRSPVMLPLDDELARRQVDEINAKVLSNRKPPYAIKGGLFDALTDAGGTILAATNEEAEKAAELFLQLEGNDLEPAAAVAVASLIQAVHEKMIDPKSVVMLNITGGGIEKFKKENKISYLVPEKIFSLNADPLEVKRQVASMFR